MSLGGFVIQPYSSNYNEEVNELISYTIREKYPAIYCNEVVNFFLNYHSKNEIEVKASKGNYILGFLSGEIIATGYLIANEIGGIYVHPNKQNMGFGRKIVERLFEIARSTEINFIWLDSTPIAKSFYESLGFKVQNELIDYIDTNSPLPYYKMYKIL